MTPEVLKLSVPTIRRGSSESTSHVPQPEEEVEPRTSITFSSIGTRIKSYRLSVPGAAAVFYSDNRKST